MRESGARVLFDLYHDLVVGKQITKLNQSLPVKREEPGAFFMGGDGGDISVTNPEDFALLTFEVKLNRLI